MGSFTDTAKVVYFMCKNANIGENLVEFVAVKYLEFMIFYLVTMT